LFLNFSIVPIHFDFVSSQDVEGGDLFIVHWGSTTNSIFATGVVAVVSEGSS
jgi:hypothetical protein